jgi:RimJ/RimL family protein N-acetyltransferase
VTGPASLTPLAPVSVRELRWSDFDPIRETYWLLFEEREEQPDIGITLFETRPSYADEVAWFASLYRRVLAGDAIVGVAVRGESYLGHCTVGRVGPTADSEAAHVGELGILVHRDHRGEGAGRALLANVLARCVGHFEVVRLSVFSTNVRARRLYQEFGFVPVGTVPRAIRRGSTYFDEELMVKKLDRPPANR